MGALRIFRKFSELLDRGTVDLPTLNTPLSNALAAKAGTDLENLNAPATARGNLGLGAADDVAFAGVEASGKIAIAGEQTIYNADAEDGFSGTVYFGDGGASLANASGVDAYYNTAVGLGALNANSTGSGNTTTGYRSLYFNASGKYNTGNGYQALYANVSGDGNTGTGLQALRSNTSGSNNVATGYQALYYNTTGNYNAATGYRASYLNTTGAQNTAIGYQSLYANTTGNFNAATGENSGRYIADGTTANSTSGSSLYLGADTKALADGGENEIVIGYGATGAGSNSVTLGNDAIATTVLKGDVGIGTATPAEKLEVAGNIKASGSITNGSITVAGLGSITAEAGTEYFCVDETGGAVPVFGDGTNWRRMTDRAVARISEPLDFAPHQWTMMEDGLLDTDGDAASSGDSISVVQNLGSGASNYLQDTGQDQPKYHTTKGIYLPPVTGNVADYGSFTIGANATWEAEVTMMIPVLGDFILPYGGAWDETIGILFIGDGRARIYSKGQGPVAVASGITEGDYFTARYGYDGTDVYAYIDGVEKYRGTAPDQSGSLTFDLKSGYHSVSDFGHSIKTAKLTIGGVVVQQTDFTTQHHNATSITPSVGGTVSISQAGNDPATVVEYPFVRLDGANSFLKGTYPTALSGGYMFCLFSVIGDGGDSFGRVFSVNPTGGNDTSGNGAILLGQNASSGDSRSYFLSNLRMVRTGGYAGTGMHEIRLKSGAHKSLLNGAGELTDTTATTFDWDEFTLGSKAGGVSPTAIDVFVLGLFDKDLSDANATLVRNYIGAQRPNLP
jgi:hypothetical protein